MTAVVLAGGRGRRLRASDPAALDTEAQRQAAARGLKILMPVGDGQRLLDHVLARLAEAGCDDVVLVVPPEHDAIVAHLARQPRGGVRTRLAVQPIANGTAGAVAVAAPWVAGPACLVVNGDTLYPTAAMRALAGIDTGGLAAFTCASLERESGFTAARVAAFAAVARNDDGWLTAIHEKPPAESLTPATRVSMNLWRLDRAMLDACAAVDESPRGEFELPDAVMLAVRRGARVRVVDVEGMVLDLTTAADVATMSRALAGASAG